MSFTRSPRTPLFAHSLNNFHTPLNLPLTVTERDFLRACARGEVTASTTVADIMTRFDGGERSTLVSVRPDDTVLAALELMTNHRIRHIPCISDPVLGVAGAKIEGMVAINDVVKALLAEDREELQVMEDYVHGVYD